MSSRRSNLILILLIVLALVGVGFLTIPGSPLHRGVKKGLDLQGGLEVVLKAQPPKGHKLQKSDLDRSVAIMRNRVDKLGVASPEIREQSPDQIVIQLAGIHDPQQAARIIGKTAELELYDLTPALVPPSVTARGDAAVPYTNLYQLLSAVQSKAGSGTPSGYVLFKPVHLTTGTGKKKKTTTVFVVSNRADGNAGTFSTLHRDPSTGNPGLLDAHGGKVPSGWKVLKVPPRMVVVTCSKDTSSVCPGDQNGVPPGTKLDYYLFKHGTFSGDRYATDGRYPNMTGKQLKLSGVRQDFDPSTGAPIVLLSFNGQGNKTFLQVTKNEATRGKILFQTAAEQQQCGAPCAFAIVLDNEIRSWPAIDPTQNPNGIDPRGSGAQITFGQNPQLSEAKDLAVVLQTGALPVKFKTLERTDVSATLGKDSLKQAQNAAIGGMIVVALFLLFLYRFLGLVAVIGLGIYAAFMYAAILLFGVTLTLPGFAGLILTIGVAADANVVIFERIKEEARAGKSVRAAIAAGYAKGFRTIVDANVVTAITALILFAVATASVKGFALMLLIGTVVSLITAVAATRAMLGLLAGFKWFENPSFMGAHHSQRGTFLQIDFMKRIVLWFAISGAAIVLSFGSLGLRGLNLGIDFKGGVQITFKTPKPTSLETVRDQTRAIGRADAVVQGRGTATGGDQYKSFQIRLKKLNQRDQTRLENLLHDNVQAQAPGIKNVSSSFGRQIARSAITAIIFSLLIITLYIAIRFKGLAFAVPVIVALLHDILITVGVYSLTGREVTGATVAAVLTVLGYSIYDTIIIFDRIRENVPIMRRASFATIVNVSLWETIRRSLATTFITLLPVGALFFFGGATLKDFAFALLIGVTSGAYSSIFIAAPIVTLWKQREPEYVRRKGETTTEGAVSERLLREAERAAAAEPTPQTPVDVVEAVVTDGDDDAAKRERRRQRRRSRPHGRAR